MRTGTLQRTNGQYFVEGRHRHPTPLARDPDLGLQLWDALEVLARM
jgi:hypothetical protein